MSKQFNSRQATQYLLGFLSAAELERFDELSVSDDEFATALQAAENDLVDAYIQGELAGGERRQFESHYLASSRRREKVEFAQAFQLWVEKNPVPQPSASAADKRMEETKSRWFSALNIVAPQPALQWGFAIAALILLIAGVWLAIENSRLRHRALPAEAPGDNQISQREQELKKEVEEQRAANSRSEQELAQLRMEREHLEEELQQRGQRPSGTAAIASFILVPQLRGAGQAKTVTIPAGTEQVAMRLQLEPNQYSTYSVTLLDQSSHKTLWNSGKLKAKGPADSKSLNVSFRAALLKPQTYVLQVSGISASGTPDILGDYPFRVVK